MAFPFSSSTSSRTILGSLTTIFTPAPACFSLFQPLDDRGLFETLPLPTVALQAVTCTSDEFLKSDMVDNANCWPSATANSNDDSNFVGRGLYSPGLMCPSGYTTACTALGALAEPTGTTTSAKDFQFVYPLLPSETAAGCCPNGYDCFLFTFDNQSPLQSCRSIATANSITTGHCTSWNGKQPISTATLGLPLTSTTMSVTSSYSYSGSMASAIVVTSTATSILSISSIMALAPMIQLNWKASDVRLAATTSPSIETPMLATPAPASPSSTGPGSAAPVSTIFVEPSPVATPVPATRGLSTGGKAAIGVVVPIAVLTLIVILAMVLRRRKRRSGKDGLTDSPAYQDKPELDAFSETKIVFMKSAGATELSASDRPQELEPQVRHELAAPDLTHELESSERASIDHSDKTSQHS